MPRDRRLAGPAPAEIAVRPSPGSQFEAEAQALGIRISAIGAYYRNPLDPKQTDFARRALHRAIEVAAHMSVCER